MAYPDATHQGLAGLPGFRGHVVAQRGQQKRDEGPVGASEVTLQDPGSLTYEPGFGLREKPFSLSSDPRFFFKNSSHGPTFDALLGGIRRREGILVLTGEVGTGKTTMCRAVLRSLGQKTFAAFVADPFLSREDLLKTLLVDFGVVSMEDLRSGTLRGANRNGSQLYTLRISYVASTASGVRGCRN